MSLTPKARVKKKKWKKRKKNSTHYRVTESSDRFFRGNLELKPLKERKRMIIKGHSLGISKQYKLLVISCSSLYCQVNYVGYLNLELMRLMDGCYLKHPYYGAKTMFKWLSWIWLQGYIKRINRLYYEVMG